MRDSPAVPGAQPRFGTGWRYAFAAVLLCFAAALGAQAPAHEAPRNPAGVLSLVEGDARIQLGNAAPRGAKVGDVVSEGDTLITGRDGEIHVTMEDAGFIALRTNTNFKVVSYKAAGGDDDHSVLALVVGGLRSVSGWIGKFNRTGYQLRTPNATIGIRGTDHETHYLPEGSSDGESGTYEKVYAGETAIQDAGGTTQIGANKIGFLSARRGIRARMLDRTPKFFVPSRHEAMIALKHDQILRVIDQKREERRKAILEKRAAFRGEQERMQTLEQRNLAASQERLKAAEEQRNAALRRQEEFEHQRQAIQEEERSLRDRRRDLMEQIAGGKISQDAARAKLIVLRRQEKALAERRQVLNQQSEALRKQNAAQTKARLEEARGEREALKKEREDLTHSRGELKEERESAGSELKGMRKSERERYLEELKDERKKRAAAQKPPASE